MHNTYSVLFTDEITLHYLTLPYLTFLSFVTASQDSDTSFSLYKTQRYQHQVAA